MKLLKNNWWNRLFHIKKIKANIELKKKCEKLVKEAPDFIKKIGYVTYTPGDLNSAQVTGATSLLEVMEIHKELWAAGFQNNGICPNKYGYFRTEKIETMKPEEVYFGGIYGLWTNNIPFWEQFKNDPKTGGGFDTFDYLTDYQIILRQYKGHLIFNISSIAKNAEEDLELLIGLGY